MNLMEFVATLGVATIRALLLRYFTFQPLRFDTNILPADYYDFIVVGAGCGGSVVAARLTETDASVLLLEAGGSAPPETTIPLFTSARMLPMDYWTYQFKQQDNAFLGYTNNSLKFSTGKMMGGSSSLSGLVYTRGNKMDYDSWARLGNTGWDYDSVLPYFKKSERYRDDKVQVDARYHGFTGPLTITRKRVASELMEQVFEAGGQLGYHVMDPNGAQQIGGSPPYLMVLDGVSATASESFLAPVLTRPHLTVRTRATVHRVLFNQRKRAVGVQYTYKGKRRVVFARKEVILSAGAVNTPHILMLSGVGPRKHLQEMGVDVVAAVEGVGKNLHDHHGTLLPFTVSSSAVNSPFDDVTMQSVVQYYDSQTGLFAEPHLGDAYFWLNLSDREHPTWPDVFLAVTASPDTRGPDRMMSSNMRPKIFHEIYDQLTNATIFTFWVALARPKSTGSVTLNSSDHKSSPVVHGNLFDHPSDIKLLVKGIRKVQEFVKTPALKNVVEVKEPTRLISPCRHHGHDTDLYWDCFVRHTATAGHHLTGSAKMAPPSDPMGVVSPRLSVRGVTGLRIIDASVMPQIIAADTMAATYMIAEKGADIIKQDWGYPIQ